MARSIKWDDEALVYLEKALEWIADESLLQAENVEKGILEKIEIITTQPEQFPPDKFKKNNQGKHRAFEAHSYRVAYTYTDEEVQILRVRHVKQEPKTF
jgi:plasmid stabilization system protein ParE